LCDHEQQTNNPGRFAAVETPRFNRCGNAFFNVARNK